MAKKEHDAKMGFNEPPLKLKFKNEPVDAIVDGKLVHFKSKLEYRWSQHLDILKTGGAIKDWFYEFHTFRFEGRVKGPYEYTPDFLLRMNDNTLEYHECKGMLQKYDLDKWRLVFEERPYVKLVVIFASKPKLSVQKWTKIERYSQRIIINANSMFKREPIDMG